MKPIVSVVMCVYNRSKELRQAIKSVIQQTFQDWEMIIIDDGSKEDLKSVVEEFKDERLLYKKLPVNGGVPVARNIGNSMATGDYIAVLDSDDIAFPERLQVQVDTLTQNPDIDVVYSSCWVVFPNDLTAPYIYDAHEWSLWKMLFKENLCFHSTVMFRRSCLMTAQYRESCRYGSDYVFLAELAAHGKKFKKIDKPLLRYCRHNQSISRESRQEQTEMSREHIKQMISELPKERRDMFEKLKIIKGVNDFNYPVTIIIPSYKNHKELIRTLEALNKQTHKDFEVIVVDDGTPDPSIYTLVKFYAGLNMHINYFWNPDRGYTLCNVRNAGMKLANGKIITLLDADMIPEKMFVDKIINLHNANNNLLAIHARRQVDENGVEIAGEDRTMHKEHWRMMAGGNISIMRDNAQMIGLFDVNYNLDWGLEDVDWAQRAMQLSIDVVYVPHIVASHQHNKTFQDPGKNTIYYDSKWNGNINKCE